MLEKTNVMRIIEQKKLPYVSHYYGDTDAVSGVDVAAAMGEDPEKVFKTLVCTGKTGNHYVFVIPVKEELDLKKAAKAVGEKSMEMLKSKDLLPLTGYIHGGCSPIGMKKKFPTYIEETAVLFDEIAVSAGIRGAQVILNPEDLKAYTEAEYASLTIE